MSATAPNGDMSEVGEAIECLPTAAQRMAVFDTLPKAIRTVLCELTVDYEVRNIARAWAKWRVRGLSAERFAQACREKDEASRCRLNDR